MATPCLLCQIAKRESTAHIVHEDDRLVAFLDRGPIRPGHTLIVSKEHFAYFDEAPADLVASMAVLGREIAIALKHIYRVPRVAFLFTGGDIAHVHAHFVPMHEKTDITSRRYIVEETLTFRSRPPASDTELAGTAGEITKVLTECNR